MNFLSHFFNYIQFCLQVQNGHNEGWKNIHVLVHVETHPHTYPQNEFTGNTFVCVVRRRVFSGSEYS